MKKSGVNLCVYIIPFLPVGYFFLFIPALKITNLPEINVIQLPEFKGRILPSDKVSPGTFTITEDFKSIGAWGEDAILTYKNIRRGVKLEVWRPDRKTSGVFQYATKDIDIPKEWLHFYVVDYVEKEGDYLKLYPKSHISVYISMIIGALFFVLLIVVLSVLKYEESTNQGK